MNYNALISEARADVASASYSPKKLTLIHTGIVAGAGLLVAVLSYLVNIGIGSTGGLSGIGTRAALQTAQTVLQLLSTVLTPFWTMGFVAAALQYADKGNPTPRTLLAGFSAWGPVLRLLLLQALLYFAASMVMVQLGSILYSISPAADKLYALVEQVTVGGMVDAEALAQLMDQMDAQTLLSLLLSVLPYLLLPSLIVVVYLAYRMRFAPYLLMNFPRMGALLAITQSFKLTKGNCFSLLKLDLRFWWFYLLEVLVGMLCYGDLVLAAFGVDWGNIGWLASLLFYILALAVQIGLYVWKKPEVYTSYALFFKSLLPRQETVEG